MNLLPLGQKKRIGLQMLYKNIVSSGFILILLILILILFLGGFLVFLNFKYCIIEQKITFEQSRIIQTETVKGMERRVKELNKDLVKIKDTFNKSSNLYQILDTISRDLLIEVRVDSIEIDGNSNKIIVSGYSPTRDKLLAIKNKLETSPKYKDIDFPISNLANPKDIDFYFNFVYKP